MSNDRKRQAQRPTSRIALADDVLATIRRHGELVYPEESCGGLLGRTNGSTVEVREVLTLENSRTDDRGRRYLIGPNDVLELERRAAAAGLDVVGYFHSHPDAPAVPSAFDREHAWPWYIYLIVGVSGGRADVARAWRLADDRGAFEEVAINDHPVSQIEDDS